MKKWAKCPKEKTLEPASYPALFKMEDSADHLLCRMEDGAFWPFPEVIPTHDEDGRIKLKKD